MAGNIEVAYVDQVAGWSLNQYPDPPFRAPASTLPAEARCIFSQPIPARVMSYRFPDSFVWGAATSAHQIEGYPQADGGGLSIWDRFAATPGKTFENQTAQTACDHYHRYRDDVALMHTLGLQAYRFSVAWARVLPAGTGQVNPKGLDFYSRLVDALLEKGITPFLTLYHWDLPAALDDRGGWLNRDIAGWFGDYAQTMVQALGDRVQHWTTLNEPWVVMDGGYMEGGLAPGHRNLYEAPLAAHHLLLAHAAGVEAIRAGGSAKTQAGLVVNLEPKYAASSSEADRQAVVRAEAYMNHIFLDPVLLGRYPDALAELFGAAWPAFSDADLKRIAAPLDFIGINYYTRAVVEAAPDVPTYRYRRVAQPQHAHTEMGWEVHADSLREVLERVHARYPGVPPIYITENGAAFYDPPTALADPHPDPLRRRYLRDHLRAIHDAISAGVDVQGYFAWSLLDNYEWAQGFSKRFGLVHVDFDTCTRTPKESAHFYRRVIETHGTALDDA